MNDLQNQVTEWWSRQEPEQRKRLMVLTAVCMAMLLAVGWWSTTTSWRTVLDNRSYDELLVAAASLDEAGVEYRIDEQGGLQVPVSDLGAARAAMDTGSHLPGLTDIEDLKLGLTPRAQEWAFLRAREGDIARMLAAMDGISGAQVSIVPAKDALFIEDSAPARASVFLRMRPGAGLEQSQVRAVLNLVANSVEGLDPSRISVSDDRGKLLAAGEGEDTHGAPGELHEYRVALERGFEDSVRQALLPVLGSTADFGVTATVTLDVASRDVITKKIDTTGQAVLSEQMDESASQRAAGGNGGAPGVDANLPERGGAGGKGSNQESERLASTMNYVYPTVDEVMHRPAGGIERMAVAVQVNEARLAAIAGEDAALREQLQQQITDAVRTAVGQNTERGDQVTVSFLPFAEREWAEGDVAQASLLGGTDVAELAKAGVAGLALLLVFGTVVRPMMATITAKKKEEKPAKVQEEPEPESAIDLAERLHEMVENFEHVDSTELNHLVQQNAGAAAQVLRRWNRK